MKAKYKIPRRRRSRKKKVKTHMFEGLKCHWVKRHRACVGRPKPTPRAKRGRKMPTVADYLASNEPLALMQRSMRGGGR